MQDPIARRAALRRQLKLRRRELPAHERLLRSQRIARSFKHALPVRPGQRVALYSPTGGEVALHDIVQWLRRLRCELYLPRIAHWRARRMRFARWDTKTPLRTHRLGMIEPHLSASIPVTHLDMVLMPAIAIDRRGNRLGMGAGFYDRAFAHRRRGTWRRPRLIAVVYDFQRIDDLPHAAFDVPVDAVLDEHGLHWFANQEDGSCA